MTSIAAAARTPGLQVLDPSRNAVLQADAHEGAKRALQFH